MHVIHYDTLVREARASKRFTYTPPPPYPSLNWLRQQLSTMSRAGAAVLASVTAALAVGMLITMLICMRRHWPKRGPKGSPVSVGKAQRRCSLWRRIVPGNGSRTGASSTASSTASTVVESGRSPPPPPPMYKPMEPSLEATNTLRRAYGGYRFPVEADELANTNHCSTIRVYAGEHNNSGSTAASSLLPIDL